MIKENCGFCHSKCKFCGKEEERTEMKRIGMLTAGGDCPGLNATIRGVAKSLYELFGEEIEIYGIVDGYRGLIHNDYRLMKPQDFSGILTIGGTILGTARTPYSKMQIIEDHNLNKVEAMVKTYKGLKLDCLLTLGGNGTHKTANLLAEQGLNVIGLPKTIDNDIWGTDYTFGFQTAVDIATEVIDRIHTTATSHKRVMVIEIMGNKVGWLTLHAGIAGGADIIVLPEIPFELEKLRKAVETRMKNGKNFSIIAVAEGAMDKEEAGMKRKEMMRMRAERGETTATQRIADYLNDTGDFDTRVVVPGHILRGGSPCAYDRVLSTRFGAYAARLVKDKVYGVTVALRDNQIVHNPLSGVAGKTKKVDPDCQLVQTARQIGIKFGD